jgi:hypothetical protein
MEHLSDNIDYYFVTWNYSSLFWYPQMYASMLVSADHNDTCTVTETDVTGYFQNKNLIACQIVDPNLIPGDFPSSFYYNAYLAKIATLLKSRYEFDNDFVYDQVIEIRPDLYITEPVRANGLLCGDYDYIAEGGILYRPEHTVTECVPRLGDFRRQTNSFGNDVLGNRYWHKRHAENIDISQLSDVLVNAISGNEWLLLDYIHSRRMNYHPKAVATEYLPTELEWSSDSQMIFPFRPNYPENIEELTHAEVSELDRSWLDIRANYYWKEDDPPS